MDLVKVKTKYQITLPATVRQKLKVNIGDIFEVDIYRGGITLKAKSLIDKRIERGLDDLKAGRTYGPFDSVDKMFGVLEKNVKKYKTNKK